MSIPESAVKADIRDPGPCKLQYRFYKLKSEGMKINYKILLLTAIFLLAAGCNKVQPQATNQPVSQSANQQVAQPTTTNPSSDEVKTTTITVTQIVEGSNLNKLSNVIPAGEFATDLLKRDHQIETKNYPGIGEMVLSIDGIKPDSSHFWAFYVNGKSSDVGASSYKPQNGDKIEWKLVKVQAY